MKKILFAASETVPFIKTGGLADVVGSLPKCFDRDEYDVRVIVPKYLCMRQEFRDRMKFVDKYYVQMNWRRQYAGIFEMEYDGVTFYFIDNEFYFAGPAPYGNIYEDVEKFAYFSKAVLDALPVIGFKPDLIHCHDWQTGLIPVHLKVNYANQEFYKDMKSVMTIHNLKFQGRWLMDVVKDVTGLGDKYFTNDKLEMWGDASLLKGGIVYADAVTTVSRTYAEEIKTPFFGENLDGLLSARSRDLRGIVNGIDYDVYNPKTDQYIKANYDTEDFRKNKIKNKRALQKEMGLAEGDNKFLIGIVSRLTDQKGFDLITYVMDELCSDENVELVILGTGEERYENAFRHFAWKYAGRVSANIFYSEALSHQIYAACDAFLMPSLFEPCGLSQLMSLRYGTLPIVRETGGLKDTVEPYNEFEKTGTGFSFANYNAHEMLNTIRYAKRIFTDKKREWNKMIERAMKSDFSWDVSAGKYAEMYDWLIGEKEEE
ncbi:MAG: glycogen synthase GlgA [Lachnospiraceae bacterium]